MPTAHEAVLAALPPLGVRESILDIIERADVPGDAYDKRGVVWAEINVLFFDGVVFLTASDGVTWVERRA